MPVKLKLISNIEDGILDIYNSNNEIIEELVFDDLTPLSWTKSTVLVAWLKLSQAEKVFFQEVYEEALRDGKTEDLINVENILININDGKYKVTFIDNLSYNTAFGI